MKPAIQTSLLAALAITGFAISAGAVSIPATMDQKGSQDQCVFRAPQENNQPPSPEGLTANELIHLAETSGSDAEMVRWYVGGQKNFDLLMKPAAGVNAAPNAAPGARIPLNATRAANGTGPVRVVNPAKCSEMSKFVMIANRDLFMTPKMVCSASGVSFTFTVNNNLVIMEMSQVFPGNPAMVQPAMISGQPLLSGQTALPGLMLPGQIPAQQIAGQGFQRSISREPVLLGSTNLSDCEVKITQVNGDGKNLKICLPRRPENKDGEGRVAMTLFGSDVAADLSCDADPEYLSRVKNMTVSGLQPPGSKALPAAAVVQSVQVNHVAQ